MIGGENESQESDWTKENLQKLLVAMKSNIPEQARQQAYNKCLKAVDWQSVAFPPFSPEACQEKWGKILQKMRKTRSLTELIDEAQETTSNPCTQRKIHPEVPKRPSPPNAIFLRENWATFHEKNPNMENTKLLRLLTREYKELSEEKKAHYEEKYQLSMTEYKRRINMFSQQYQQCSRRQRTTRIRTTRKRTTRKRKVFTKDTSESGSLDRLPLKPPLSGYNLFCKEQSGSMTGVSLCTYKKVWAQRWQGLTDIQKEEYRARCEELKKQYKVKLNDYVTKMDIDMQNQISEKHGINITKVIKSAVTRGEPEMPPRACNLIFFKDQMKRLKTEFPNSKERFIKVSQQWKGLSNREKESYRTKLNKKILEYQMELQKWFQTLKPEEQDAYLRNNPNKRKYLDVSKQNARDRKEVLFIPTDSEDEDIEYSSSNEADYSYSEEEEEEEDMEDIMFTMF